MLLTNVEPGSPGKLLNLPRALCGARNCPLSLNIGHLTSRQCILPKLCLYCVSVTFHFSNICSQFIAQGSDVFPQRVNNRAGLLYALLLCLT